MPCSTHAGFEAAACHAACMPLLKQQHANKTMYNKKHVFNGRAIGGLKKTHSSSCLLTHVGHEDNCGEARSQWQRVAAAAVAAAAAAERNFTRAAEGWRGTVIDTGRMTEATCSIAALALLVSGIGHGSAGSRPGCRATDGTRRFNIFAGSCGRWAGGNE